MSDVIKFPGNSHAARAPRVLIADDNKDTVLTLENILGDEGYAVRGLPDGSDVLRLLRDFDPDICILDIEMPGENGFALARQLRSLRDGERPMLIAISGVWIRPSDRMLAIMVGFDHFFQKPAEPGELLKVLADFRAGRDAGSLDERVHIARG